MPEDIFEQHNFSIQELQSLKEQINSHPYEDSHVWGSHGPNGDEPVHYVVVSRLQTVHIENILLTQDHITPAMRFLFLKVLRQRWLKQHDIDYVF